MNKAVGTLLACDMYFSRSCRCAQLYHAVTTIKLYTSSDFRTDSCCGYSLLVCHYPQVDVGPDGALISCPEAQARLYKPLV